MLLTVKARSHMRRNRQALSEAETVSTREVIETATLRYTHNVRADRQPAYRRGVFACYLQAPSFTAG